MPWSKFCFGSFCPIQARGVTGEDNPEAEKPLGNVVKSRKYRTEREQKKWGVSPGVVLRGILGGKGVWSGDSL